MSSEILELEQKVYSISIILDPDILDQYKKILIFCKSDEELKKLEKVLSYEKSKENLENIYRKILSIYNSHKRILLHFENNILKIEGIYQKLLKEFSNENIENFYRYASDFHLSVKKIFDVRRNFYYSKFNELKNNLKEKVERVENSPFVNLIKTASEIENNINELKIMSLSEDFVNKKIKSLSPLLENIEEFARNENDKELLVETRNLRRRLISIKNINKENLEDLENYGKFLRKIASEYLNSKRKVEENLFEISIESDVETLERLIDEIQLIDKPYGTWGLVKDFLENSIKDLDRIGEKDLAEEMSELYKLLQKINEKTYLPDSSTEKIKSFFDKIISKIVKKYMELKSLD